MQVLLVGTATTVDDAVAAGREEASSSIMHSPVELRVATDRMVVSGAFLTSRGEKNWERKRRDKRQVEKERQQGNSYTHKLPSI